MCVCVCVCVIIYIYIYINYWSMAEMLWRSVHEYLLLYI